MISQAAFDFASELPVADTITAQNETLYVSEWAKRIGLSEDTLRKRLAAGWDHEKAVTAPKQVTNRPVALRRQVPDGAPGSWTWHDLAFEDDQWCQDFVKTHPDGASMEVVGAAMGVEVSWICEIEQGAIAKLLAKLKQVASGTLESTHGQLDLLGGRGNAADVELAVLTLLDVLKGRDEFHKEAAEWLEALEREELGDDEDEGEEIVVDELDLDTADDDAARWLAENDNGVPAAEAS